MSGLPGLPEQSVRGKLSIVGPAGAAVLCTVLTQHLYSNHGQSELYSEILCWAILPVLFTIASHPSSSSNFSSNLNSNLISNLSSNLSSKFNSVPGSQLPSSSISLWVVAAGVATACCYKAEIGTIGLLPVLTPLLLIFERQLRSRAEPQAPWFFSSLVNTATGAALATAVALFTTVSGWNLGKEFVLSTIPAAALLVVYVALIPRGSTTDSPRFFPRINNVEEDITPLSRRVVVVLVVALGAQGVAFGLPTSTKITPTLFLGSVKALSWYFTIQTARYTSWCTATAMATFAIVSTRDPSTLSSEVQSVAQVVASFLVLGQIIHMLPRQAKAIPRSALWAFMLVSLVPHLAHVIASRSARSSVPPSFGRSRQHPVEALVDSAKEHLDRLLQRQSQNYTAAHGEYRRRYGAEPPPGFEAWFGFAVANQSPIIDDFDIIFDAISPFWALSGKEVVKIVGDVQHVPNIDLWSCTFSGESAETRCTHPQRTFDRHTGLLFNTLLGDLRGVIPDVQFLVNHLDQPRVVLTPPPRLSAQGGDAVGKGLFRVTDLAKRSSWDALTRYCASRQLGSRLARAEPENTVETFGLPFVTDRFSEMDLCRHPEYSDTYGLFMSPSSFGLIEALVPILSTGALSTMGDVLFPSPAYIEDEFRYDSASDVEWDSKSNDLYWAGSTTGGFALDDRWRDFHRQRFVALAQNLDQPQQHSYLRQSPTGVVRPVKSAFLNRRSFDVSFTRIFQCEYRHCRDQRFFFDIGSWAHKDRALRSRLVFDLDGNGISGRYYKLLASASVPLKQTLLREWHDERLVPWAHYVPVSVGLGEVPELVTYLAETEAGRRTAREVAEAGREWFAKALRDVDMTVYVYRLMLELARLQDPKREAS